MALSFVLGWASRRKRDAQSWVLLVARGINSRVFAILSEHRTAHGCQRENDQVFVLRDAHLVKPSSEENQENTGRDVSAGGVDFPHELLHGLVSSSVSL